MAAAIVAGLADAGNVSEPAALAYDLAFVPLAAEYFDLVIPAGPVMCCWRAAVAYCLMAGGRWTWPRVAA